MNSNNDSNNTGNGGGNKDLPSQEPRKATQDSLPLNQGQSFETGVPASNQEAFFSAPAKEDDDLTAFDDDNWDNNDFETDFNDNDFKDEFDDQKGATSSKVIDQSNQSFLKKNFHYIAIGATALVGGYFVISTLFPSQDQTAYVGYQDPAMQQPLVPAQDANNPFAVSGQEGGQAPVAAAPVLEQQGVPAGAGEVGLLMGGDVTSQSIQTQVLADSAATGGLVPPSDWNAQQPPMPAPISKDGAEVGEVATPLQEGERQVIGVPVKPVMQDSVAAPVVDSSLPATSEEDTETVLLTNQPPAAFNIAKEIQATGSDPVAEILAPTEDAMKEPSPALNDALKELAAPAEAPKTVSAIEAPEVKAPVAAPEMKAPETKTPETKTPVVADVKSAVVPTLDAPKTETPKTETSPVVATPSVTPTTTSSVESEQIEFLRQNLANAENRIKAMDNRFEAIMGQLESLNQKVSLLQTGTVVPASKDSEVKTGVQDLKDRIKDLEKEVKDTKASASEKDKEPSFPRTDSSVEKKKTAKAAPKKTVKKETKPDTKNVAQKPSVEIQQPAVTKSTWVLRAAQPNVAWVSQGADSPIKKVTVGDTLPSVGRVQSVTMENGRWVVRGSETTIYQ